MTSPIIADTLAGLSLAILAAAIILFCAWAMARTGAYMFRVMLEQARRQIRREVENVDA